MFAIDKMSRTPIYEQFVSQFESGVLSGDIAPDAPLPSVRMLSKSLNVNPNTLQRAYSEIERRGLCYSVPGSGRYLTADAVDKLKEYSLRQTGDLLALMQSLKLRGISKETVLDVVNEVFETVNNDERMVISE